MPKKESIDTANLGKSLKRLESKYEKLGKFKILFLGILIGVIISALIQLLIMPLSFEGTTIKYGEEVWFENVKAMDYFVGILVVLILGTIVILVAYKTFVFGFGPTERVQLRYTGDYRKMHENLSQVLRDRCSTLDVRMKAPDDKRIFCSGKGSTDYLKDYLLKIVFRPDLSILELEFMRESMDSTALIDKIRELYG